MYKFICIVKKWNLNGEEDFNRPHPLGWTKEGSFWHFSSLPISLYYINEVISCDIATQSHVRVVDLVLCQDTLYRFIVQLALGTLDGGKKRKNYQVKLIQICLLNRLASNAKLKSLGIIRCYFRHDQKGAALGSLTDKVMGQVYQKMFPSNH